MSSTRTRSPANRLLNGWGLFALITVPVSASIIWTALHTDLSGPYGVSSMIQYSVRTSVPWLYIAFTASSLVVLAPGPFSRWLLRNRKYIGLSYAAAMAWQLTFIVWFVTGHWDYYLAEAYAFTSIIEQVPGYLILTAMVITSFRAGREKLTPKQWRILHKTGIYFLWAVVWSTYWYELYYYDDIQPIDHFYYWAGLAAWGTRIAAWTKKHRAPAIA